MRMKLAILQEFTYIEGIQIILTQLQIQMQLPLVLLPGTTG